MQQGQTPFHLLQLTDMPALIPQATDTVSPNVPVPIYFIHSLERPFCRNPRCKCQWQQREVRHLLNTIVEGAMTLREAANFLDDLNEEVAMSERKYSGNPYQTPVKLHKSVPSRHTTDQYTARPRPQMLDDEDEEENPDAWTTKTPTSAIRRTAYLDTQNPKKTRRIPERRLDRSTLIIVVSLIIIVMVGGWWLLSTVSTWWSNWQDDLHFGNPRTFQVDQFVGQGDSPDHPDHFIAVNIHGRVIVVQLNMQHPELDQTYGITTTDPTTPVSLTFRPTGTTWAMYVLIGTTAPYTVELVSNGTKFVSPH